MEKKKLWLFSIDFSIIIEIKSTEIRPPHNGGRECLIRARILNVYGAQELIPRFRQPMYAGNRFLGSLKGLQIQALLWYIKKQ